MLAVVSYLVSETTGILVTHSGISFLDFLGGFPSEPFPFDLQSFCIWQFLPNLWQVISDLADDSLPEPLPFLLWRLLKSICFKAFLINCSMSTLYAFGIEGWSWNFCLLVAGYIGSFYRPNYCTVFISITHATFISTNWQLVKIYHVSRNLSSCFTATLLGIYPNMFPPNYHINFELWICLLLIMVKWWNGETVGSSN